MFEQTAGEWERANLDNRPYLTYTPDPEALARGPSALRRP
jgi:hypothetical protein